MLSTSTQFQRQRQDLLAGTATDLLVQMGARIRTLQEALAQDDEYALAAARDALPMLRSAVDRLLAGGLDAASLARLASAVRALPDRTPEPA